MQDDTSADRNKTRLDQIQEIVEAQEPGNLAADHLNLRNGLRAARMRRGEHNSAQLAILRQSLARQAVGYGTLARELERAMEIAYEMEA